MRLQRDWCDIPLVLEAAIACLPQSSAGTVSAACDPGLPVVWADHDRLEQVFVNLLHNAISHNPPGTRVRVTAGGETGGGVAAGGAARGGAPPAAPAPPPRPPRPP